MPKYVGTCLHSSVAHTLSRTICYRRAIRSNNTANCRDQNHHHQFVYTKFDQRMYWAREDILMWRRDVQASASPATACVSSTIYRLIYIVWGDGDWRLARWTQSARPSCPWDYYKLLRLRLRVSRWGWLKAFTRWNKLCIAKDDACFCEWPENTGKYPVREWNLCLFYMI